jgi:hypothetical protein
LKVAAAVIVETDDLAVEDHIVCANAMRDFRTEHVLFAEDVAAARREPTLMALDVRERADTIVLDLEQPIGPVEWLWQANEVRRTKS